MKLIVIFGPLAVGKMTVGQALEKDTDYKLFHNHVIIEMLKPFFEMKSVSFSKLERLFSTKMLTELLKSELDGVIYTYAFDFNDGNSIRFMNEIESYTKENKIEVFYIELTADVSERLVRNKTDNRLKNKPSKLDIADPDATLIEFEKDRRFSPNADELRGKNYIKIDNTNLSPQEVAARIKKEFKLL